MKYIKKFENVDYSKLPMNQLKKYLLIAGDNKNYSIVEVFKLNYDTDYTVNSKIIYKIDNDGIRKVKSVNADRPGVNFRFTFLIKRLVNQSDDVKELLKEAEILVSLNKYNI